MILQKGVITQLPTGEGALFAAPCFAQQEGAFDPVSADSPRALGFAASA